MVQKNSKIICKSLKRFFKNLGALKSLKRLSTNYLLIFHIWGGVFRLVGYLGYYIVKPKYMELQYRQSASSASFFTGKLGFLSSVNALTADRNGFALKTFFRATRCYSLHYFMSHLFRRDFGGHNGGGHYGGWVFHTIR